MLQAVRTWVLPGEEEDGDEDGSMDAAVAAAGDEDGAGAGVGATTTTTTTTTRVLRSTRARATSAAQTARGHHGAQHHQQQQQNGGHTTHAGGRGGRKGTQTARWPWLLLWPSVPPRRRKTLVLDLDETLIHSTMTSPPLVYDTTVEVMIDTLPNLFYVARRPHAGFFLSEASKWYDLVIFTASMAQYAEPVIDWLDPRGLIKRRYFRESCTFRDGTFFKNLTIIESDLSQVCIIDNSPIVYSIVPDNAIPIKDWTNDRSDDVLLDLLPFLEALSYCADVRSVLSLRNT